EPVRGQKPRIGTIERPFIEGDLHCASAQQHGGAETQSEGVHVPAAQAEYAASPVQKDEDLEEPCRITETVPPEVHADGASEDGIDAMHERTGHAARSRRVRRRARPLWLTAATRRFANRPLSQDLLGDGLQLKVRRPLVDLADLGVAEEFLDG